MLSPDEHPGIFTFLIGIIVLVMAGVGLSVVIDRRLSFSSGALQTQRDIHLDASELEELTARHGERSRELAELEIRVESSRETLGKTETLRQMKLVLEDTRQRLLSASAALEVDFMSYRADYRRKTRAAAVGESLGNLVLRGGREYQQATITRVTDVGLEIRHVDGIARIQAPDLGPQMQDRFQWSDEDRRKVLEAEKASRDAVAEVPEIAAEIPELAPKRVEDAKLSQGDDELGGLRRQVIIWQSKVRQLRSEWLAAQSNAGYGSQKSLPGSLETWNARAARLGNELARASASLAIARSNLAAVAPGDPLLRPLPREP